MLPVGKKHRTRILYLDTYTLVRIGSFFEEQQNKKRAVRLENNDPGLSFAEHHRKRRDGSVSIEIWAALPRAGGGFSGHASRGVLLFHGQSMLGTGVT